SNLATQIGETERFSLSMHTQVINQHADESFTLVLCNNRYVGKLLPDMTWVKASTELIDGWEIIAHDLVDEIRPWRHDSKKLAVALMRLLKDRAIRAVL
ncbi:MAG: YvcK family protein, partial [Chloroflexota bacterium]|nr:YvcK family protein [Chloroflexota bacterium]